MEPSILPFEKVLTRAVRSGQPVHILLGNGFSIGAWPAFGNELLSASFREALWDRGYKFRDNLHLMGSLEENPIVKHFEDGFDIESPFYSMREAEVKSQAMAKAVGEVHPKGHNELQPTHLCNAAAFVGRFRSIFTSNYDLLLCWVTMHSRTNSCNRHIAAYQYDDGFRPCEATHPDWKPLGFIPEKQDSRIGRRSITYLHGALHLIPMRTVGGRFLTNKISGRENRIMPSIVQRFKLIEPRLLEVIEGYGQFGYFPICIAAPTAAEKLEVIQGNDYLRCSFELFKRMNGHLFTYGWSFSHADQHIIDALLANERLLSLNVGIYQGDSELQCRVREVAAKRAAAGNLQISFYRSESAAVWESAA